MGRVAGGNFVLVPLRMRLGAASLILDFASPKVSLGLHCSLVGPGANIETFFSPPPSHFSM